MSSTIIAHGDSVTVPPDIILRGARKQTYLGRFFMTYAAPLQKLVIEGEEALKTIIFLTGSVRNENQVYVRQADLARKLRISRATVERHLHKLRELGLLIPDPAEVDLQRGIRLWRICPYIVWIGEAAAMQHYVAQLPETHVFHAWSPAAVTTKYLGE